MPASGGDWTLDGSLRSTASWDSAIEASLVGSNSSTLAGTTDVAVRRRRDLPFPPAATSSPPVAVGVDPMSDRQSCDSDRSSLGGGGDGGDSSPGPRRRAAAAERLRGACRSVLRKVENRMKRRGSTSPTGAAAAVAAADAFAKSSSPPMEISSPTVVDEVAMRARMDALRCVDLPSSRTLRQRSAPTTPTNEPCATSLDGQLSDFTDDHHPRLLQQQRSVDSTRVISIYDNVVAPQAIGLAAAPEEDPQRQLDDILSVLYRDIGMLSTSLAVVHEEGNVNRLVNQAHFSIQLDIESDMAVFSRPTILV